MMTSRIFRKIANAGRGILLAISLLAVITALVYAYAPEKINSLDRNFVHFYLKRHREQLNQALLALKSENPEKGIQKLEGFLEYIDGIKKRDRLDPEKRKALRTITGALLKQKRSDRALHWYDKWVAFDDRDLFALVGRGKTLMKIPGKEKEGEKILAGLFQRVPEAKVVTDGYVSSLLQRGRIVEAFLLLRKDLAPKKAKQSWGVYWKAGRKFSRKRSKFLEPTLGKRDQLTLRASLPGKISGIRIDPPPDIRFEISEPKLEIVRATERETLEVWKVRSRVHHMTSLEKGFLTSGGNDPYMVVELTRKIRKGETVEIIFRADISFDPEYRQIVEHVTSAERAKEITQELLEQGERVASLEFMELWKGRKPGE